MDWSPGIVIRLRSSWLPTLGAIGCKNVFAWDAPSRVEPQGFGQTMPFMGFGHTMQFMRVVVEVKPRHLVVQGFNDAERKVSSIEKVSIQEIEELWRSGWVEIDTGNAYIYEGEPDDAEVA